MVSAKFYENNEFNISDGTTILDLNNDIDDNRPEARILCDDGDIKLEFEFNEIEGFIDLGNLNSCDGVFPISKVKRIRLTALEDNSAYRVWGGLS